MGPRKGASWALPDPHILQGLATPSFQTERNVLMRTMTPDRLIDIRERARPQLEETPQLSELRQLLDDGGQEVVFVGPEYDPEALLGRGRPFSARGRSPLPVILEVLAGTPFDPGRDAAPGHQQPDACPTQTSGQSA